MIKPWIVESNTNKAKKRFKDKPFLYENNNIYQTKRTNKKVICRVVPADFIYAQELLDMPKENYILPEEVVLNKLKELRATIFSIAIFNNQLINFKE